MVRYTLKILTKKIKKKLGHCALKDERNKKTNKIATNSFFVIEVSKPVSQKCSFFENIALTVYKIGLKKE